MKNNKSTGIGTCGVLGIAFIVLKLIGVISWSWLWVLSPFWISAGLWVVGLVVWVFLNLIFGSWDD